MLQKVLFEISQFDYDYYYRYTRKCVLINLENSLVKTILLLFFDTIYDNLMIYNLQMNNFKLFEIKRTNEKMRALN